MNLPCSDKSNLIKRDEMSAVTPQQSAPAPNHVLSVVPSIVTLTSKTPYCNHFERIQVRRGLSRLTSASMAARKVPRSNYYKATKGLRFICLHYPGRLEPASPRWRHLPREGQHTPHTQQQNTTNSTSVLLTAAAAAAADTKENKTTKHNSSCANAAQYKTKQKNKA